MKKFSFTNLYTSYSTETISFRCSEKERWLLDQLRKDRSYSNLIFQLAKHSLSPLTHDHKKFLASFPDKNFDLLYKQFLEEK